MIGIYIHGKRFTDLIMTGQKTMETRNSPTLSPFIGQTVGIVLTGCGKPRLVGTVKITGAVLMDRPAFRACESLHCVAPGSRYDIKDHKIGYTLSDPCPLDRPVALESTRGNRIWRELP